MSNYFVLSFKKNISIVKKNDCVLIQSPLVKGNIPQKTISIEAITPGLMTAINTLGTDGATEEELSNLVLQSDGFSGLPKFYYYLQKFVEFGMICHTIICEKVPLATRVPISPSEQLQFPNPVIDKKQVLSRFAYCHKENEQLVLESPLSHAQIILEDWRGAALIAELAKPQSAHELGTKIPNISEETIQLFFSLLLSAEMLCEVKEDGKIQEEESETLVQWRFHDLLFHSRTRTGRHSNPIGRTYRFLNKIQPLPVVKPKISNEIIDLYKPDIKTFIEADYPFTRILEERKSIRTYKDNEPISDKQLGEFLYRSARIKKVIETDIEELSSRPYVNAGAAYELELYITVNTCENIPSGLYHYCPKDHQLCKLSGRSSYVEALLEEAQLSNRKQCVPQLLIIIAARFPRITWNYDCTAYATILKNVGALYQTMYLVATAMTLAPCALGQGNSDLFTAAAGTAYYAETSVGEFMLGSKPAD